MPPLPYSKVWLSVAEQVQVLVDRGLVVGDGEGAAEFLLHQNYYRFSGYTAAFVQAPEQIVTGTTFLQVRQSYEFDRALRDLCAEAIELIELDVRTATAYTFAERYGPFGHTDSQRFHNPSNHARWLEKLRSESQRSSERFIGHHKEKYSEYPNLPLWVATEVMSFGTLSILYRNMFKADQKRVASRYRLQPGTFGSWLHHLVYVRNLCAHHARLWDKQFSVKPDLPPGNAWQPPQLYDNSHLYVSLLVQSFLLSAIHTEALTVGLWRRRVEKLVDAELPACPNALGKMGLPAGWKTHPHWNIS
jgi:abortive infection bacteriophage resistance protein